MSETCTIGFVILHYNAWEETLNCVESILRLNGSEFMRIVVVDNHSPNESGVLLQQRCTDPRVQVILLDDNIGFSRANNIGYKALKEAYHPDFIIVTNNDTLFEQTDFAAVLYQQYEDQPFYVGGPDVWAVYKKVHQSPLRMNPMTYEEISRDISRNWRGLYMAPWETLLRFIYLRVNRTALYRTYRASRDKNIVTQEKDWSQPHENVVLQGACVIFSKLYIREDIDPFSPETYFYYEEEILATKCRRNGWRMAYMPQLQVTHLEGVATGQKKYYQHITFRYRELYRAGKVYRDYLRKYHSV